MEKWSKYFAFFIAILPITDIYGFGFPGISIGKLIITILLLIGIACRICNIPSFPKGFLLYFLYMLIIPQIFAIFSGGTYLGDIVYKSVGSFFFLLIFGYGYKYLNVKYFIKYYETIVVVCCLFFLMQEIVFSLFNIKIIGLLSLPLTNMVPLESQITLLRELSRSSSIFLEPAHFAQYLTIFLVLKVFSVRERFLDWKSILISLIIILSRSGIGYAILLLVWGAFFIYCIKERKHIIAVMLTFIGIGGALFLGNQFGLFENKEDSTLSRVGELSSENVSYTSGYVRIYRGYVLYLGLKPTEKVFGIGAGNLESYVAQNSIPEYEELFFSAKDDYYLNGIQQHLIYGGIIGLFLYLLFLFKMTRKNNIIGTVMVLVVLLLSFISMTFNSVGILQLLVLAALFQKQNNAENEKNNRLEKLNIEK